MTITYVFGNDPEALHRAMRLVLAWKIPITPPVLDPTLTLDQGTGSDVTRP